ncbi:MAG TPA: MFS transporter [Bryobacteraceae bacterium]|nr:MFS transporter [Bryobacteraceae bacterium]
MIPQPISEDTAIKHRAGRALLPLLLFCAGHFFVDLYSGALGSLQPLLAERFGMNFTQAGILGAMLVFSSSTMQPLYGYLSDRYHSRMYAALAPAVAGIFISAMGWSPSYLGLLLMVFLGGAGIAAFHPQGASNAVAGVRSNKGRAMAIFISAGSLGFACGPSYFSAIAGFGGLAALPWAAVPGVLTTVLMLALLPPPVEQARARSRFDWAPLKAVWKPLSILYFLVFLRSVLQVAFTQFLPLFLHVERGYTLGGASASLTVYLLGGAIGGLAGGSLADRFGGRRVIMASMIGSVPFLALFLFTRGPISAAGLFAGGLMLMCTLPVNVIMAQDLAPTQSGTVSALMMGFAWGTAGMIFIPLAGWFADLYSMQAAFKLLLIFPVIGFLLSLRLPK